ncbi:NADPH oxidase 4-like isoform X2 [Acipenser ruthenus]|uniref:NADPH oxidase 4-like isoform X2 n=1 Tax=Acipenser ruthenus TaxID=7906 RepID=UPI00145A8FCF|nr:NADPH oxidase 4-like isoform X2 [Acipenser ruthenus]
MRLNMAWKSWISNECGKHLLLLLWLAVNVWLFWKTFILYYSGPQYYYLHRMLGLGLCISRASASVLNLNCSLVLLPVCRTLLAFLRGSQKVASRKARRLLDKSKTFHAACGVTVCIFSDPTAAVSAGVSQMLVLEKESAPRRVVHVAAHMVNILNFSARYSEDFPSLNVAHYKGEDPRLIIFTTVPGVTGILMVLILFLMFTASSYSIRVSNYDIFWYTHNLFIVFYILLLLHVAGGALKYQSNVEAHRPGCFSPNKTLQVRRLKPEPLPESHLERSHEDFLKPQPHVEDNFGNVCKEEPHFKSHFPETWLWVSGPLCLYCAERLYRYFRNSRPVTIVSVTSLPCDVIEVRMVKKDFKARPGQYIVLQCPSISTFESHPFTLTVCPTEKRTTFGVHLRVLGDWTKQFKELLLSKSTPDSEILPIVQQRRYPTLYIDGPFGSPSEEVFNYEVSLCVAGGIGVTPFASVLHTLLDEWRHFKLRRLYLIWVCREIQSFYWFADLLCALHQKLWQENRPDYLNIKLYLSRTDGIQNLIGDRYRALNSRLIIGRPRWKLLFEEISKCNRQKNVGVFCCGPKKISKTLHKLSNSTSSSGTTFEYNKESFS